MKNKYKPDMDLHYFSSYFSRKFYQCNYILIHNSFIIYNSTNPFLVYKYNSYNVKF